MTPSTPTMLRRRAWRAGGSIARLLTPPLWRVQRTLLHSRAGIHVSAGLYKGRSAWPLLARMSASTLRMVAPEVPALLSGLRQHVLGRNGEQAGEKEVGTAAEPDFRPQLRTAALIALAAAAVLLPTQAFNVTSAALPPLLLIHGIHTLIAGSALI